MANYNRDIILDVIAGQTYEDDLWDSAKTYYMEEGAYDNMPTYLKILNGTGPYNMWIMGGWYYMLPKPPKYKVYFDIDTPAGTYNYSVVIKYEVLVVADSYTFYFTINVNPPTYSVTFAGNGGQIETPLLGKGLQRTCIIPRNSDAIQFFTQNGFSAVRSGYSYIGLGTSASAVAPINSYIVKSVATLYVIWGYKVNFDPKNGESVYSEVVPADQAVQLNTHSRTGYAFKGWNRRGYSTLYLSTYTPTADNIYMDGVWALKFTLSFSRFNIGSTLSIPSAPPSKVYDAMGGAILPTCGTPTPQHSFSHWCLQDGSYIGQAGDYYNPAQSGTLAPGTTIKLYPVWLLRIKITYNKNTTDPTATLNKEFDDNQYPGASVTLATAQWHKHDFMGWYTVLNYDPNNPSLNRVGGAGSIYTIPSNANANISLYAGWRDQYEIIFTDTIEGVSITAPAPKYCSQGQSFVLPPSTTSGLAKYFSFDGWYNGNTLVGGVGATYTPTGDVTLTAKHTQIGGPTGDGEWRITHRADGTYDLTLMFYASDGSTADYTSATDPGNAMAFGVFLKRWVDYRTQISSITVAAEGNITNIRIGAYALAGTTELNNLSISPKIGSIGPHAFEGCTNIRDLTIGSGVTLVEMYAFHNCKKVRVLEVGDNVKTIRTMAFATDPDNSGILTMVRVPNSVTSIEAGAFGSFEFKAAVEDNNLLDYAVTMNFVGYDYVKTAQSNVLIRHENWYVIYDNIDGVESYTLYIAYSGAMPNSLPGHSPWHIGYPNVNNPNPQLITGTVIRTGCTSVGSFAFYGLGNMKFARLPDTILSIGNYGFAGSGITSLTIPDSVISIADGAFQNCESLAHLTIGSSVATIGSGVFEGCDALTSLEIPIDLKADSETTFNGMTLLTHVTIVRGRSGVGTTYTATYVNGAFEGTYTYTPWHKSSGNNLTITLRDGILSIGQAAFFHNAGLRTITIPDSVISIGTAAFSHCSNLTAIKIPSNIKIVSARTFERCTSLVDLSIGGTVTAIGDYAFYGCTALPSLIIPNSVTTIGYKSFSDCTNLMSAVVGSSVTSIGLDAPGEGDDLITDYPNGPDAFLGCVKLYFVFNLSPLDIVAGASTHGYVAFYAKRVYDYFESSGNVEFVVHNGYVFSRINGKDYLIGYTGTDTEVAPPAEYEYHGETITSYGVYQKAFLNSPITSIVLPDTVTEIDDYAFYGCKNLSSVLAPPTCKRIGNYAFSGCDALQQIVLPSYLRTIGEYAFSESALTSITIPRYVDSMGTGAFLDSVGEPSHLTSVTFAGYTPIPAFCFMGCISLTTANTPYVTQIGISAFDGCSALTEILIPDSVILVGEDAFAGCSGLTKITIGDKTTGLDMEAFPGFTFTEYGGVRIRAAKKMYGYTYVGANYVFTQKGNVFKFTIRYFMRNSATPFKTETYVFTRRDTACILADNAIDDRGVHVKKAMAFNDSYSSDGMLYRFKYWSAGSSGYSGARVLPGDKYEVSIYGVNEEEENLATLDLHAHYEWDDDIQFYLKKYSKQHAAKFQQELQSPEWYTGADGQQNLIPLYKTTEMFVTADSTAIAPGKVVYGKPDGTGVWNYFFLGNDNEITEYDAPFTDPHTLEAMHDLVGVTFDLSSCQIQSLSRTIKANLTTIPTMIYGAENRFIIDLGTQMSYTLRIVRVNPPNAVSLDNYQFEHGRFRWGTALTMDWTTWYAIKDEVGFANLTNGDFYRLLLIFVDEWQNNLRNSDAVLTGGFEFFCSSIDSLQFNKIDKRVFIAGTIQAEVDVQKMSISIPLTVASMQTDDTSLENVKVTAYIKAGSLADITGAFDKQVEYSFPLSANIPTPLPPIDWELYMGSRAPPKSFNGWRVEPEGSSSYTVGIGEFMTITSAANMYAQWADGVTGGAVTPDSGIPGTTPGDNAEFKTLCELYGELVKPNHLYTLAITMVGGGGGGNPWSGSQIDPLIHAGGGGGGGGGALRFSIEGVNSSKDKIAMVKGRGGKGPILYTPPQTGAIHIANATATGSYDGGDSIFKLKKDGQSEVFVFTAKGGKSFENGFVFLAGHVGDAFKRGLSGGGYTLPSSGYTLDYAANGGDGGYGGDTSDGQDGGLPEIVLGSATDANWKGGKGGKRASVQYLVLFQKWMGGGAGGGAAAYDVKNDKTSRGGDGGTYTTDATAPIAGGGGGGGVRSQQIINDFNTRRTHGAQGDIYVRILGGTPAP